MPLSCGLTWPSCAEVDGAVGEMPPAGGGSHRITQHSAVRQPVGRATRSSTHAVWGLTWRGSAGG
jgi:hypothetical protein